MKKTLLITVVILSILSTLLVSSTAVAQGGGSGDIVAVNIQSSSITWTPKTTDIKGMTLTITGPGNYYSKKDYGATAHPTLSKSNLQDGVYTYEIVLWPNISPRPGGDQSQRGLSSQSQSTLTQSGAFTVLQGAFVTATQETHQAGADAQGNVAAADIVHPDDVIVQASLCVGFDCVNNESFGFDTIRLKENNLRIKFEDTSVSPFPTNDWQITANDSASGGASFLGFEDITGAKFPFKVVAGAPTNSLFVSSTGNVGLGTGTPVLDVHVSTSDTPALRLEQTNAGGFTAQTWDVAGNEANFFVRDVTGGSLLPFRIRPGAPTSSLDIAASGNVGIGTASPAYDLDVSNTGAPTLMAVRRTDGVTLRFSAGLNQGNVGTENNFPLVFNTNNVTKMTLATDGSLTVVGPVNATAFNVTSDKYLKENFVTVDPKLVLDRLATLPISTWNFIETDNKTLHMGPMAQDFHAAFGLGADDKHISTIDADGVALVAIQELNKRNETLSSENVALRSQVDDLAARVSALESSTASSGQFFWQNGMIVLLVGMNLGLMALLAWSIRRGSFLGN